MWNRISLTSEVATGTFSPGYTWARRNDRGRLTKIGLLGIVAAGLLFEASPVARGASYYWQVQSGDWSVASNWGGTMPTSSDTAYIVNGGTATITQLGEVCGTMSLGNNVGTGTVLMTSGSLLTINNFNVGDSGTGIFTQSGGTNTVSSQLNLGFNSNGYGIYNLSGSGLVSAPYEYVGLLGSGTFTQSGGTNVVSSSGFLDVGFNSGTNGSYSLKRDWPAHRPERVNRLLRNRQLRPSRGEQLGGGCDDPGPESWRQWKL